MNAHTIEFAKECGYAGNSPAMLNALEAVRQQGIREARKAHFDRKLVTDAIKRDPGMISAIMRPAQSIDEALEDVGAFIVRYRNMPTWRRQNHAAAIRKAKALRVNLRYFRRFAAQIMAREAA